MTPNVPRARRSGALERYSDKVLIFFPTPETRLSRGSARFRFSEVPDLRPARDLTEWDCQIGKELLDASPLPRTRTLSIRDGSPTSLDLSMHLTGERREYARGSHQATHPSSVVGLMGLRRQAPSSISDPFQLSPNPFTAPQCARVGGSRSRMHLPESPHFPRLERSSF